jgi:hypothetical protein
MLVAAGAAAMVAAGCGDSDGGGGDGQAGGKPANPPSTLTVEETREPVTLVQGAGTHDADVTIDRATGRIYVAWAKDGEKGKGDQFVPGDSMVAYSDDGGQTFSVPVRTNDERGAVIAGFNAGMRIVATGENRVLVIWPYMTQDMSAMNVMGQLSTDGGKTWSKAEPVTSAAHGEPSELYGAMATYGKNVYVGYLDYGTPVTGLGLVRSSDGGKTFGEAFPVESSTCACCDNALTVDGKGTLFLAFRDMDQQTAKTQIRDTGIVRSYDNGKTWSDPIMLGDDNWEFNGCPESGPELAVDGDDTVHGVYWTGKPGRPGVYYTSSKDGGASFTKPAAVAVDDFYPPPYIDIAVQDDGTGWIVWDDRRTKDRQVHLARVKDGKVETTDGPMDAGVTPAIDTDGSMVAMTWSNDEGLHVGVMGTAAKDGYGSGPGDADSGQDEAAHEGH